MYGSAYSNGGTPVWDEGVPRSAHSDSEKSIVSPRTDEGKFAKVFINRTNLMTFDSDTFAVMVNALGGEQMQPRIMEIVKALIFELSGAYDLGMVNAATIEAKRLHDTMEHYQMG